jgi:hypothetical protein
MSKLWTFVLAGQSNMVGLGINSQLSPVDSSAVPSTYIYYNGGVHANPNSQSWLSLAPGFGATQQNFGPELSFGRRLQEVWTDRNIAIIKIAEGGTQLSTRWLPPNGDLYKRLISEVKAQINKLRSAGLHGDPQLAGFAWMQGEADACEQNPSSAYFANLTKLFLSIRGDLGVADLPISAGWISPQGGWAFSEAVRMATALVSVRLGQVASFDTIDLKTFPNDKAHFDSNSNIILGQRFANAIAAMLPLQWHFPGVMGVAQGDQCWTYRERNNNGFSLMTYDASQNRWFGRDSGVLIGSGWMHPGANSQAELAWWAPYAGTASISFTVKAGDAGGDGTTVLISDGINTLWGPVLISPSSSAHHKLQLPVEQGREIQFRTSSGPNHNPLHDTTLWGIDIRMIQVD